MAKKGWEGEEEREVGNREWRKGGKGMGKGRGSGTRYAERGRVCEKIEEGGRKEKR